ncbi:hypothetical protein KSS87_019858 [Heliosperma pusillum]|nr:hypothetical protein KSS87_019858 [Heliosperma pusillum]
MNKDILLTPLSQSAVLVGIGDEYLRHVETSASTSVVNSVLNDLLLDLCGLSIPCRFHVFGIGQRTLGFSVRIAVKTASKVSEVIVGPENRTAISNDNFLRVNMVGDFAGYTNIPSFEDFYLVIPRQHGPRQPPDLGRNFSLWMLLERVRFTLDGLECNKIGVGYEAFNGQPDFCAAPFWSCLHNQLWNFFESHLILKLISVWLIRKQPLFVFNARADQNRIGRNQPPLYGVVGRFERINDHPDAGPRSFSIGITEVLNTNLLIELGADDIEYVYQRSPGKILGITVPTFEALAQFGIAKIETKNVGEVEASYSLTFQCSKGVMMMEEQFFIMKPEEVVTRSFKIDPTTDQAAKYACSAILKDSEFKEVDRAECQFTTIATVLDNGTQGPPFQPPKSAKGLFESIKIIWNKFWAGLSDFIAGKSCRRDFLIPYATGGKTCVGTVSGSTKMVETMEFISLMDMAITETKQTIATIDMRCTINTGGTRESHLDKDQEHDLRHHKHRKDRKPIKKTTRFRIDDQEDFHEPHKDDKRHLLDEKYGIRRRD